MRRSKHFRKDVIMARAIVLGLAIVLILLIIGGISLLTKKPTTNGSEDTGESGSQIESESEKESQPESEPESESETLPPVESESESESESEPPAEPQTKLYVEVECRTTLNVRVEPNTNCEVIAALPDGTLLEFLEELDGWYKVTYEGKVGYVSSRWSKIVEIEVQETN